MAKFMTNIQLEDANKRDYEVLHQALETELLKSEKHDDKAGAYVAGKQVFILEGDFTLQDVNEVIFRASSKTGKKYSFFVIKDKKVA